MTIYLDISAAVHKRAGLGRYAESLAAALAAAHPDRIGLFYNREQGIEPPQGLGHLPAHTVSLGYKPWRLLVYLGQLTQRGMDGRLPDAELFHATEHLLPPFRSIPTVLTIHDLIFAHLPSSHKRLNRWYLNLALPLFCRRATRISAVSEQTRQDLVSTYRLPPDKITVVHEAAHPRFRPPSDEEVAAVRVRYGLPPRYLLFVGTIEPRKNLVRLLTVFEALHKEGLTDGLVVAGKKGWLADDFFARLAHSPARSAIHLPGYIPDHDLPALYGGAQALLFISLYEGFGLPVLEAMACGLPVVTANSSSLPEIGGKAALYVSPTDTEEVIAATRRLLRDPDLWEKQRLRGLAQAARFSWERAALETWSVYEQVLASR